MIRPAVLLMAFVLALGVASAQSAPPRHQGGKGSIAGTTAPVAAPAPPPPGSSKDHPAFVEAKCEHGCGYTEDNRPFLAKLWTDPVAAFTAVLAVFTAVLAVSTIGLWRVTGAMARTSDRAVLDLERPIVYGGVSVPGLKIEGGALKRSQLELSIYNHGRTMARLRRIEWDVRLASKGSIAEPINPAKIGGRELPAGTVCITDDPYGERENLFARFTPEDADKVAKGELSVWVIGFIRYDDVFGRHHISGFTQVFDPIGERFVRRGSDLYNYERTERTKDIPPPSSKS